MTLVSADVSQDAKNGTNFYMIRIMPSSSGLAELRSVSLVPGMPVEAFVQTPPRTIMSYLVRPLTGQMSRAFREKWQAASALRLCPVFDL